MVVRLGFRKEPATCVFRPSRRAQGSSPILSLTACRNRCLHPRPPACVELLVHSISVVPNDGVSALLVVPQAKILISSQSMVAFLSKHWLSNEVALEYAGGPEYEATALSFG